MDSRFSRPLRLLPCVLCAPVRRPSPQRPQARSHPPPSAAHPRARLRITTSAWYLPVKTTPVPTTPARPSCGRVPSRKSSPNQARAVRDQLQAGGGALAKEPAWVTKTRTPSRRARIDHVGHCENVTISKCVAFVKWISTTHFACGQGGIGVAANFAAKS